MLAPALTAQPHAALMQRFCSLGENCELGIAQRRLGAEPADLLRWADIGLPALLRLLRGGCAGIGDPAQLSLVSVAGHYFVAHREYGFRWHSLVGRREVPDHILRRETVRMPRLAETLLADFGEASRIFVVKRREMSLAEAQSVLDAIGEFGDATLMFVTLSGARYPGGGVAWVAPRLLHGRIAVMADTARVADETPVDLWLALCQSAAALVGAAPS